MYTVNPLAQAQAQAQAQYQQPSAPYYYGASTGAGGGGGGVAGLGIENFYWPTNFTQVPIEKKKEGTIMQHLKDYFKNNRDLIFNVAIIILIDHFVFKGVFREKIKDIVDRFCLKTHEMMEKKDG